MKEAVEMLLAKGQIKKFLVVREFWGNSKRFSVGRLLNAYDEVAVVCADIVGFTGMSANRNPLEIVEMLNNTFTTY